MNSERDTIAKLEAWWKTKKHETQSEGLKYEELKRHLALIRRCAKILDTVRRSKRMYEDIANGGIKYWDANRTAGTGYEK